jgi:hypothetical protein
MTTDMLTLTQELITNYTSNGYLVTNRFPEMGFTKTHNGKTSQALMREFWGVILKTNKALASCITVERFECTDSRIDIFIRIC